MPSTAAPRCTVPNAEHCVFCRFLSEGNSYKDCGHPCEQHRVHLRDEQGADHLVLADMVRVRACVHARM